MREFEVDVVDSSGISVRGKLIGFFGDHPEQQAEAGQSQGGTHKYPLRHFCRRIILIRTSRLGIRKIRVY